MMMKKIIFLFFYFCLQSGMYAQQDPLFSQYIFNGLVINPAYAGSHPYMTLNVLARKQWFGMDKSPSTQAISWNGPLKSKKAGLGLILNNDRAGIIRQTDLFGSYSYHLSLPKGKLNFGLSGGLSFYRSFLSDAVIWEAGDAVYAANSISNTYPNFGAGAYYHNENYYFGISMPRVLSYYSQLKQGDDPTTVHRQKAHFYVTGGYMIETKSDIKIKPSALIKYVKAAPIQFDINLNLLFNNIVWAGLSFRSGDAISLNLEYQLTRKLRVGYAYDYTISRLRYSTSGSHEICIGYDFGYDIMKMKNPRYF